MKAAWHRDLCCILLITQKVLSLEPVYCLLRIGILLSLSLLYISWGSSTVVKALIVRMSIPWWHFPVCFSDMDHLLLCVSYCKQFYVHQDLWNFAEKNSACNIIIPEIASRSFHVTWKITGGKSGLGTPLTVFESYDYTKKGQQVPCYCCSV